MKEIENSDIKDEVTNIVIDLILNRINNLKSWCENKKKV